MKFVKHQKVNLEFAIFLMIWGYKLSIVATSQAYSYAIIRYIRDGHAITDEKSLFHEEEWINPPINDNPSGDKVNE